MSILKKYFPVFKAHRSQGLLSEADSIIDYQNYCYFLERGQLGFALNTFSRKFKLQYPNAALQLSRAYIDAQHHLLGSGDASSSGPSLDLIDENYSGQLQSNLKKLSILTERQETEHLLQWLKAL